MLGKENSIFKIKKKKKSSEVGVCHGSPTKLAHCKEKEKYINYTHTTTKNVNTITALLGVPQEESLAASQLALRVRHKLHAYIT